MEKAFGSGYFGEWTEGLHGVPAYRYTVNQLIDKKALTMTNPAWNSRKNHTFVFGNDRITATASNFGYVQVRQDEGCPKYLTDFDEKNKQFGGGFGYLKGKEVLSTYYDGGGMLREYGAGYFRKKTGGTEGEVEETVFAPYGDDPVLIKTVKITNLSGEKRNFEWYDYWAGEMYQFTFTHYCAAQLTFRTGNVSRFRRRFARSFIRRLNFRSDGVSRKLIYDAKKENPFVKGGQAAAQGIFRGFAKRFYDNKDNSGVDLSPPDTYVVCLNGGVSGVITDAEGFFGGGNVTNPEYFRLNDKEREAFLNKSAKKNSMLTLKKDFVLENGGSVEFTFAYIYIPDGFDAEELIRKYSAAAVKELLENTLLSWKEQRISLNIPGKPWIDRELLWHNAYLRGSMSYASYFDAHVLSQGGHYQYLIGLQGAPRDQLQHSLSFIYTEPYIAREHILFTLREMSPEGELPYATHGNGMMVASVMVPSDLQLMLLSYVGEYILAARDYDFLSTKYVSRLDGKKVERTVLEGCLLAYKFIRESIGLGQHGLMRMKTGDWNDQAVYGRVRLTKLRYAQKYGESMLNSAMAVYSFEIFGEMLKAIGNEEYINALDWSEKLKAAVKKEWNGKWFRRAFLGDDLGWLGDDILWLEPQPWTIITDTADDLQKMELAKNIKSMLCAINPNGAALISHNPEKSEDSAGLANGVLENGGIWPAINGYLVWALAKVDGEAAFEEWQKNSRAFQAEAYPDIWYGIWSGPDAVSSSYAKYPGRTQNSKNPYTGKREKFFKLTVGVDWEDFPVLNLHAHTWQQYTVFKLLGISFRYDGITFAPVIPYDIYSVSSPLISFERAGEAYKIRYTLLSEAPLTVRFKADEVTSITLNGAETAFKTDGGYIVFSISGRENVIELFTKG